MNRRFCVAPMMRYSHRHARHLWRLLAPSALLYSEMLTANAVIHGRREQLLAYSPQQQPVALQLGGCDPAAMARAAAIGEEWGYAEININCGCPSPRVQNGQFGACLMRAPKQVAAVVRAVRRQVAVPVTVKCRLAVDDMDADAGLDDFVQILVDAGIDAIIVHARRAWLAGLNPAQNRHIPPLDYARVRRLKKRFSQLPIILNGGLETMDDIRGELPHVDGVMLGRAVCRHPYLLNDIEQKLFGGGAVSRQTVLATMLDYIAHQPPREWRRALMTLSGLFHSCPHNKLFRRQLALPPPDCLVALKNYLQTAPQPAAA